MPKSEQLRIAVTVSLVAILATVAIVAIESSLAQQPTRLEPDQVPAPAVAVVEWATCTAPAVKQPDVEVNCAGLELYRFRLADGTVRGPYLAMPAPPGFVADPAVWTWKPLQ